MSDAHWSYLDSSKEKQGPLSIEDLLKLFDQGAISEKTFVWRSGMPEWQKLADVEELRTPIPAAAHDPAGPDSSNLLTQRMASSSQSSAANSVVGSGSGIGGFLKIAAIILVVVGGVWANRVFHILPGSTGASSSTCPDRWFSPDNREGAIIQCTFDRKGRGSNGGVRYRVAATVSAGVARGRRLPLDRAGSSQVVIRDSDGNEVFNQAVSNAKLCPS